MLFVKNGLIFGKEPEQFPDGEYMTVKEFAKANDVSEGLVRQWKKRGHIDALEYGGRVYVRSDTEIRSKRRSGRPSKYA